MAKKDKKQKTGGAGAGDGPSTSGQEHRGRHYTLSIAVPGSILDSVTSMEAAAVVAGQVARAAVAFQADEVVVYDDGEWDTSRSDDTVSASTAALARILQYLETPPHLRPTLLPTSRAWPELKAAETLCPPLLAPHHETLKAEEWRPYREGVVMRSEPGMGSFVDIGYDRNAHVQVDLPAGRRVTLALGPSPSASFVPAFSETMLAARVVPPSEPRTTQGIYWGFSVRVARSLSRVLKEAPWKGGYDLSIGTSKEGVSREVAELVLPRYKHGLVVFGGMQGLEEIAERDEAVAQAGKAAADLFSMYLNCVPGQGCAGIRTEDAVWACCAYLHAALQKYGAA